VLLSYTVKKPLWEGRGGASLPLSQDFVWRHYQLTP